MSQADRRKWDERYRTGSYAEREHPTRLLEDWQPNLPRGRALDVACGTGRNALFLAASGYEVDAVDISAIGLERAERSAAQRGLRVNWIEADLDAEDATWLPAQRRYDLIVKVRYVSMDLMPVLLGRLDDGGYLLCEQHLVTNRDVVGPTNPAFRFEPNELLRAAQTLRVLFYYEGIVVDPDDRPAALAQLIACRGSAHFDIGGTEPA